MDSDNNDQWDITKKLLKAEGVTDALGELDQMIQKIRTTKED